MAVGGYFIDKDRNYHEILLGFEPCHGTHIGVTLGSVLLDLLQKHGIENQVLTITTDNAINNSRLTEYPGPSSVTGAIKPDTNY